MRVLTTATGERFSKQNRAPKGEHPMTSTIQATTTRVTGDVAVNVAGKLWILRDTDGIDLHAADESNTADDITLGERIDHVATVENAINRAADLVVLGDAERDAIAAAFA